MEINWSIFGWITAIIVLYLVGVYEGRSTAYKKRKREEEQEKKDQPAPAPIRVDDPGVLRITIENGSPSLDLDGVRANTTSLSPDQQKRLMDLSNMIRGWLNEAPFVAPQMEIRPPLFTPTPFDQTQGRSAPVQPATPPLSPTPSLLAAAPKGKTGAKDDRPNPAVNSIVGQIDSILQSRMAGTLLAERGVFLSESPEGGVIVFVGLNKYMGVDEVPDEQVKAAIRAAIAEWEKKYTPGL